MSTIQPKYKVTLSQSPLKSNDNTYTGFSKYNEHDHLTPYGSDPRFLEVYLGEVAYIVNDIGELIFPENTLISSIKSEGIYLEATANQTLENQTLHLFPLGENPNLDSTLLDNSRKIYSVSTVEGSSLITLSPIEAGFTSSKKLSSLSRNFIRGEVLLPLSNQELIIPPNFSPQFRLFSYQFELEAVKEALTGEVSLDILELNEDETFITLISDISLTNQNDYRNSVIGLEENNRILTNDKGLAVRITNNTLQGSSLSIVDLQSYNSLNDLVLQGLNNTPTKLRYWLELVQVELED